MPTSLRQQSPEPGQVLCPGRSWEAPRLAPSALQPCPPAVPCSWNTSVLALVPLRAAHSSGSCCSALGKGHGQRQGVLAMGTLSPGSHHSSCPAGHGQLLSIQPRVLLQHLRHLLTQEKGFWVMGSSGDVGTPPIKGTRMCAMSPGGLAEGAGAGLSPELLPCWAAPCAPSEGIWGSPHALSRLQRCGNGIKGEAEQRQTWRSRSAEHGPRPCDTAGFAELQLKLISFP